MPTFTFTFTSALDKGPQPPGPRLCQGADVQLSRVHFVVWESPSLPRWEAVAEGHLG